MAPKLRRRKGDLSDKLEGGCAKCCAKYCRMTPMTQALVCTVVVLGITGAVVWFGGSVLGSGNGASACSTQNAGGDDGETFAPTLDIFLKNTGIVTTIMLLASIICCLGFVCLCCGDLPLGARIVGVICLIVTAVGTLVYSGWTMYGTYSLTQQPDCITAYVYLAMMYFYLFTFLGASVVAVIWKLHDVRTGGKSFKVNIPT